MIRGLTIPMIISATKCNLKYSFMVLKFNDLVFNKKIVKNNVPKIPLSNTIV